MTEQLEEYIKLISSPTEESIGSLLEKLLEHFSAERGCLWSGAEGSVVYRGNEELKMSYPFSRRIVLAAVKTRLGFLSFDLKSDDRIEATESIKATNIRSCLCAPARRGDGKVLSVIYFDDNTSRGVFTEEDLEFIVELMSHYPGATRHAAE